MLFESSVRAAYASEDLGRPNQLSARYPEKRIRWKSPMKTIATAFRSCPETPIKVGTIATQTYANIRLRKNSKVMIRILD